MSINKSDIIVAVEHSKHKIEWAKMHISNIERIVEFLISREGYTIRTYMHNNTGNHFVEIGPENGLPAGLPLHIGDAIHNLNSVMDFLWSGLARAIGSAAASKVTFPRDETRKNLDTRISDAKGYHAAIHQAFPQARTFILDEIQPYQRPDGFIWSLNKLDNINKHRLLIATTNIISFGRDFIATSEDGSQFVQRAGVKIHTDGPRLTLGFSSPFKIENDPEPALGVVFGEVDHFSGEPILETMVNLTEAVAKTLQTFEERFL